jgi:hypothetical protein
MTRRFKELCGEPSYELPKDRHDSGCPGRAPVGWLTVRCLGGRAKWTESGMLSLKMDVLKEEAQDKWSDFFASKCRDGGLELRSTTVRTKGSSSKRYD